MQPNNQPRIGLLAIRVSSDKQGLDGDSPEAQREQGEAYAKAHNIIITKTIVLLESASHEDQPMQKVIDACKEKGAGIQVVVIKSIDRFTRGGGDYYSPLKKQLTSMGIDLEDMYGVIGKSQVNTLQHTGFKYYWSEFNPTQKSEYLEAERAKDEMRDIMSRMIGAEIRYTQLGYWMRQPHYGYRSVKVDTKNGKRIILKPHKHEAKYITRMFEMRAAQVYTNQQIADELNAMGFKTRVSIVRDKYDRTKIKRTIGGRQMDAKMVDRYASKLVYCGVIKEKWTHNEPVKAQFDGLVSVELFNEANRGRINVSINSRNQVTIEERAVPEHLKTKQMYNPDFPYKQVVACPKCNKTLSGSASRGKKGKYYPSYHCARDGHYFRVPKPEFDKTIEDFVRAITIKPEYIDDVITAIAELWREKQAKQIEAKQLKLDHRDSLQNQIKSTVDRMRVVTSETALKYLEEDIVSVENELAKVEKEIANEPNLQAEFEQVLQYAKYILEHLSEMLLDLCNPLRKAAFFGAIFNSVPTYTEINLRTHEKSSLPDVNELFLIRTTLKSTYGELADLFLELAIHEDQLHYPIYYAIGREGKAWKEVPADPNEPGDLEPIFSAIISEVPAPKVESEKPFQMLVTALAHDSFKGRYAIGRINRGSIKAGDQVAVCKKDGSIFKTKAELIFMSRGTTKFEVENGISGDIVQITGLKDVKIGETVADANQPEALPVLEVEAPTLQVYIGPNTSPFKGTEGEFSTSRQIGDRLNKELEVNIGLRVEESGIGYLVSGRGELHLSVLIETMRREGYEFEVGRPQVVTKEENGQTLEPLEELIIEVPAEHAGSVQMELGQRRATLKEQFTTSQGATKLIYELPTRALLGLRNILITTTKGTVIMNSLTIGYQPQGSALQQLRNGALISFEQGTATPYSLENAQARGEVFVGPGTKVYAGQVIGLNNRSEDLEINIVKEKHLTNIRSSSSDGIVQLVPYTQLSLEQCLDFIENDELLEVTPQNLRLRKRELDPNKRKRLSKA